jgi:hypothetical protein
MAGLDGLQINSINDLLSLIDNCVSEANEHIAYLSAKLSAIKEELMLANMRISQLEQDIQVSSLLSLRSKIWRLSKENNSSNS